MHQVHSLLAQQAHPGAHRRTQESERGRVTAPPVLCHSLAPGRVAGQAAVSQALARPYRGLGLPCRGRRAPCHRRCAWMCPNTAQALCPYPPVTIHFSVLRHSTCSPAPFGHNTVYVLRYNSHQPSSLPHSQYNQCIVIHSAQLPAPFMSQYTQCIVIQTLPPQPFSPSQSRYKTCIVTRSLPPPPPQASFPALVSRYNDSQG